MTTTLAAPLADSDTEMQVSSSEGFLLGDYINVGTEILKVAGPGVNGAAPTTTTWQVARAQKLTEAAAAEASAVVYRLRELPLHFVLPPGFTLARPTINLTDSAQYHVIRFRPGHLRILHASLRFTATGGASSAVEHVFNALGVFEPNVAGTLPGMRTASGGLGSIQIPGPLATGDDLAMPLILPGGVSIGVVYAAVAKAPLGQPIRLQLKLDGENFGPVAEIPVVPDEDPSGSGIFLSGAQKGDAGGSSLSISILQVGSETPGEDLTVYVTI